MDCLLLLWQQLICCIILLFMESVPMSNAFPFLSTNITDPVPGNVHTGPSEQITHTGFPTSDTANFHIQPTKVKQMTQTNLNLIAAITEATMNSKSEMSHPHHRHQHKHRHMSHSLKENNEHHWHQSTRFLIESTPTQVQTMKTKAPYLGDTNSIITSSPTTEALPDLPKLSTSSPIHTSGGTTGRAMTSMFTKDLKITETTTSIGIKASIFPVVHPITDSETSTPQQTSTSTTTTTTTTTTTPGPTLPGTSYQTTPDITTPKNVILQTNDSIERHLDLEPTFKTLLNQFANLTVQPTELEPTNQSAQNESLFNQERKGYLNELMVNKTITSEYIQPTPILLMPHLNTKYRPSHFNNPAKESTQRPARNILSLNMRGQSQWKNSKDLMPSRSGLLHLTENDPPTSYAYKPMITHKKDFTSLPREGNAKVLAAVTTEFMKSSEVIPDLFVTPTKTQKSHSTKSHYEGHGGTGPSSVTAALSFKSKDEHLILSATATLSPSRMTYTCTIPCTQPGCMCCQDPQLAQGTATTAVTRRPPSNTTPNIQVSTDKNPAEQISLSAKFGIGMGCLIAIWLVVGPVICLICRIRDQVKGGEGNIDTMEMRKKQQKDKAAKKDHPLTEAIVMDELNKQFTKKKNSRENEYLLLAKDKAELECLSRADLSKTITKKPMSTFDRTRSPHCLNKWDESDIEDDSEEDEDEEKDRFTPVSNTPTVSV